GDDPEMPYYVMGLAEGGSLDAKVREGLPPPDRAVALFQQAADALAHVHAKGIRHCDVKPGNILLDARGQALLADFGQAHLAHESAPALGTLFYMAPEQATLEPQVPDTRWDVYGLGAVLYMLLTGKPPRFDEEIEKQLRALSEPAARLKRYRD